MPSARSAFVSGAERLDRSFTTVAIIGIFLIAMPIAFRKVIDLSVVHDKRIHDILAALPAFFWAAACGSFAAILSETSCHRTAPRALFAGFRYVNKTLWLLVRLCVTAALCTIVSALPLVFVVPKGAIVKDVAFLVFLAIPILVAIALALLFTPTYFIAVASIIDREPRPFGAAFGRTFARAARRRTAIIGSCTIALLFGPLGLYAYFDSTLLNPVAIAIAATLFGTLTALTTAYTMAVAIAYDCALRRDAAAPATTSNL